MKNKICHRTMGCEKKEECIEEACIAWGVIAFVASDKEFVGRPGNHPPDIVSEPVYGCRRMMGNERR